LTAAGKDLWGPGAVPREVCTSSVEFPSGYGGRTGNSGEEEGRESAASTRAEVSAE